MNMKSSTKFNNNQNEEADDDNVSTNYSFYVQHGDYDIIKDLLRNKQSSLSANYIDTNGCSLVQWAAINNRFNIMNLLIDNGADLLHTGGVLGENCLHWAMRARYYNMVELLIRKNKKLLEQKNKNGSNALLLSYEIKDWYLMLLLLSLGSDPNCRFSSHIAKPSNKDFTVDVITSTDTLSSTTTNNTNNNNENNTLLLTILKNDCSHEALSYILLLLKFGANPGLTNNVGDNVFHVMATNPKTNLFLIFKFFQHISKSNNRLVMYTKNENNMSPYDVSLV